MIDREQIGLRILVLRKKAGLSQADLSEKLGISAQAVSKWESGNYLRQVQKNFLLKMRLCSGWGSIYVFQLSDMFHVFCFY